jgi:hypothetical protein
MQEDMADRCVNFKICGVCQCIEAGSKSTSLHVVYQQICLQPFLQLLGLGTYSLTVGNISFPRLRQPMLGRYGDVKAATSRPPQMSDDHPLVVAETYHGSSLEDNHVCRKCDMALWKKSLPTESIRSLDVGCCPHGLQQVGLTLVKRALVGFVVTSSYLITIQDNSYRSCAPFRRKSLHGHFVAFPKPTATAILGKVQHVMPAYDPAILQP